MKQEKLRLEDRIESMDLFPSTTGHGYVMRGTIRRGKRKWVHFAFGIRSSDESCLAPVTVASLVLSLDRALMSLRDMTGITKTAKGMK